MSALRWVYHRLGQIGCFLVAFLALYGVEETGLPAAITSVGFLFGGIALHALHAWRQMDDPERE